MTVTRVTRVHQSGGGSASHRHHRSHSPPIHCPHSAQGIGYSAGRASCSVACCLRQDGYGRVEQNSLVACLLACLNIEGYRPRSLLPLLRCCCCCAVAALLLPPPPLDGGCRERGGAKGTCRTILHRRVTATSATSPQLLRYFTATSPLLHRYFRNIQYFTATSLWGRRRGGMARGSRRMFFWGLIRTRATGGT